MISFAESWISAVVADYAANGLPSQRSRPAPAARRAPAGTSNPNEAIHLEPRGTHLYPVKDQAVPVGDTELRVTVSDLSMAGRPIEIFSNGQKYSVPILAERGAATVDGSEYPDRIAVSQDDAGNTVLDVTQRGRTATMDLGRIAALTIAAGGADDRVAIAGRNYYGGVAAAGDADADTLTAAVDYALREGVTLAGGAGDDRITLSGQALASVISGNDDKDQLNISDLIPDTSIHFAPQLTGDDDNDSLFGSAGRDIMAGGAGNDYLQGFAGNDTLWGGADDDTILGGAGYDWMSGDAGSDLLQGGRQADVLRGGAGNDYLYAGPGVDWLHGGAGADNIGPFAWSPRQIYATQRVGDHLQVNARGELRSQPVVTNLGKYQQYGDYTRNFRVFQDYDAAEDFLVDRDLVV